MTRHFLTAALLAAAASATPALAGDVTVDTPIAAASLHEGRLDMVAYYTETEMGAHEVVATFADRKGSEPMRVVMALEDGDSVHFSMPGHPEALYGFSRTGDAMTVSVDTKVFASAETLPARNEDL